MSPIHSPKIIYPILSVAKGVSLVWCLIHEQLVLVQIAKSNTRFIYFKYTKILEVNLFALAYRLFHEDFSSISGALHDTQPLSSFIYTLIW